MVGSVELVKIEKRQEKALWADIGAAQADIPIIGPSHQFLGWAESGSTSAGLNQPLLQNRPASLHPGWAEIGPDSLAGSLPGRDYL